MNPKDFWNESKHPAIGQLIKVILPGEYPWAEIVEIIDPYTVYARVDNTTIMYKMYHDMQLDDIGIFVRNEEESVWSFTGQKITKE